MASVSNNDDEGINGINVTPLVDVTLVLLIIFMVTAKLIAGHGVPLDLPKAATAGTTQTMLTLSIDSQGHVLANGKAVDDQALRAQTVSALRQNPELDWMLPYLLLFEVRHSIERQEEFVVRVGHH